MANVNYDKNKWVLYSLKRKNEEEKKKFVFLSIDKMERINQLYHTYKGMENIPDNEEIEIISSILDKNNSITTSDTISTICVNQLVSEWVRLN